MTESTGNAQSVSAFRAVLTPHRSLGPQGFIVLMSAIAAVSFAMGLAFYMIGAWPVFGFFGLDAVLIYAAFKLNYRSGRCREMVEVTPERITVTKLSPGGRTETFEFNPFWARVLLREWPDGRTELRLAAQGRELLFAQFLTDDERRDFAGALRGALVEARGARI